MVGKKGRNQFPKTMMDYGENLQKCQEYIKALEEEKRKIEMFQRELPLCLVLVTQAIETYKQQLLGMTTTTTTTTGTTTTITIDQCLNGQSECSEQTASDGPVFEEFIPIKRPSSSTEGADEEDDDELESRNDTNNNNSKLNNNVNDKSSSFSSEKKIDWLRSVQLWNQSPDPPSVKEENQNPRPRKVQVVEVKSHGGAFHPFQKAKNSIVQANVNPVPATAIINVVGTAQANSASSSERAEVVGGGGASGGSGVGKEDGPSKDGHAQPRKARRCWSPELHETFLNALHQLGGSHVATPKQIRELMKVDGLTNDEVKSHLQKYRLHMRRPTPAIHNNTNAQAPQFVVVGGIWVPPAPEYAAVAPGTTTTLGGETATPPHPRSGVYAPVAAPAPRVSPQHHQQAAATTTQQDTKQLSQSQSEKRSHSNGRCSSPATSSSTHMTTISTASLAC